MSFIDDIRGYKLLDGVFNHVGESHFAFLDVLENGKYSKYADWFDIIDWGNGGPPGRPGGVPQRPEEGAVAPGRSRRGPPATVRCLPSPRNGLKSSCLPNKIAAGQHVEQRGWRGGT